MELFICLKKFSRWAANQCFIAVGSELSQIYVIKRGLSFEKKKKEEEEGIIWNTKKVVLQKNEYSYCFVSEQSFVLLWILVLGFSFVQRVPLIVEGCFILETRLYITVQFRQKVKEPLK